MASQPGTPEKRVENLNGRMERRGLAIRYSVAHEDGRVYLNRHVEGSLHSTVRCGTEPEIAEFLHAMMVALDDAPPPEVKVIFERAQRDDEEDDEETGSFTFFLSDGPLTVSEQEIVEVYMRNREGGGT